MWGRSNSRSAVGAAFRVVCILPWAAAAQHPTRGPIAVILSGEVTAYHDALDGLRSGLARREVLVINLASRAGSLSLQGTPVAIVAFGSRAVRAANAMGKGSPVIASMILDDEESAPDGNGPASKTVASVSLEIPPAPALARLKHLFPKARRVALVHGASKSAARLAEWQSQSRALGLNLTLVRCSGARDLLDALALMQDQVDFVWNLPDTALYEPAVISRFILESIRRQIPMIGFSEGFVRAGATVGFYPDYRDIGAQTAELVALVEAGRAAPERLHPRTVRAAVNERVLRLLGLDYRKEAASQIVVIR